jgi:hypothetical protein
MELREKNMKALNKTECFLLLLIVAVTPSQALPVVEWNTVGGDFSGHSFFFGTDSPLGGASVFGLLTYEPEGWWARLDAEDGTMGISHKWFAMEYGALIDATSAAAADPFAMVIFSQIEYGSIQVDYDVPFYLGFQMGTPDGTFGAQYGWVELLFNGEAVSVGASATERTGLGIYAGTGTAVPEPATTGLLLFGAAGLAWRRRRPR